MRPSLQLQVGGKPVTAAVLAALQSVEVEENADGPDAMVLELPVNRTANGDLQFIDDGTFEPYTQVSVILSAGGQSQCIFDGYVLSWQLHLDRVSAASTIRVWAQDASWLMNVDDKAREWPGLTDGEVANSIFASYGFLPADANTDDDSPAHDPAQHTLFQRATDLQFLHALARRNGKIFRVACADRPGVRTGYFVRPAVEVPPAATITFDDPADWTVDALDLDWDIMRPTEADASQVSLTGPGGGGVPGNATSSGLAALGARNLAAYAGRSSTLLLTATADVPELQQRTAAVLREAGWFSRCRGEADLDRLGTVMRAATVVAISGAGTAHSGNWYAWRVNNLITVDSCRTRFTLVRNAVGPPGRSSGGVQ
jgi:hypothetical protein